MAATIWTLLRASFAAIGLVVVLAIGSAHAQTQVGSHRVPSPLFVPAIALIGAGAYLAYRRSRPTS